MGKKTSVDVLRILADFQKNVLQKKPSVEQMVHEVQMMHFKIKPLQGDVSLLNLEDKRLIETLWNLGKLDELFREQRDRLSRGDRKVFFRFLEGLYDQFQEQLGKINLKPAEEASLPPTIEMEIYREDIQKKKLN